MRAKTLGLLHPLARRTLAAARRSKKAMSAAMDDASPVLGEKQRALLAAVAQIEGQFGKGTIMKLGETSRFALDPEMIISTGSLGLDYALGVGGLPRGRVIEIFGPESSGKTTLALHVIAEAQKKGLQCAFIDAEHALDADYAGKIGVSLDDMYISQPDSGEQALEVVDTLVRSGGIDVVVVDSVAALTPKAELEGEMGDAHMALQARLMSQALRKLTGSLHRTHTMIIFINQIRMKIGVMFGNPETTTGGNALKFYASVRLDIRRVGPIKVGDKVIGNRTRVKVVKNKVGSPFKQVEFDLEFGHGICKVSELIDLAIEHNIISKKGSWFSFEETSLGQGKDSVKRYLQDPENEAVFEEIKNLVSNAASGHSGSVSESVEEEEDTEL